MKINYVVVTVVGDKKKSKTESLYCLSKQSYIKVLHSYKGRILYTPIVRSITGHKLIFSYDELLESEWYRL